MTDDPVSPEVVAFMTLFNDLKRRCDNSPEKLLDPDLLDSETIRMCRELWHLSQHLCDVIDDVDPHSPWIDVVSENFLESWKEFLRDYDAPLDVVFWGKGYPGQFEEYFMDAVKGYELDSSLPSEKLSEELSRAYDRSAAKYQIEKLQRVFAIDPARVSELIAAKSASESVASQSDAPRLPAILAEGIGVWDSLNPRLSEELTRYLYRRRRVPRILVRTRISSYGDPIRKRIAFRNLEAAVQAYLWGADLAAIGMIRATLEIILSDLYGVEGKLGDMINSAAERLPRGANQYLLHHIREVANHILHGGSGALSERILIRPKEIEKEIERFLFAIKELIEGAP